MTRDGDSKPTLAAALERILWDNSSTEDRRFLLAPLSRMFESIAWEPRPREGQPTAKDPDENVDP